MRIIEHVLSQKLSAQVIEERDILCGDSAQFQGDERDVVFLSMVDSSEGEQVLRLKGDGSRDMYKQRYNVAASRARDQLWVVYSMDPSTALQADDLRKKLIDFSLNPSAMSNLSVIREKSESPFEEGVATALVSRGYNIVQQWQVGAYRLDMVVMCKNKKIAIECDGERWHSTDEAIRSDMERQTILERIGWRFIRIRGGEYFRNPKRTIDRVVENLTEYGIEPEKSRGQGEGEIRDSDLLRRVKNYATSVLKDNGITA